MGVLTERVDIAFERLEQGDFSGFVLDIMRVSDVRYANHMEIVKAQIEGHLGKINKVEVEFNDNR